MKLGLFGGTFDPPHTGHLIVAQDAREALALDRVLFVPAGRPPHKQGQPTTPAPVRLALVRAAVAGDPAFAVDDRETRRPGPSYTVDTLRALHAERPDDEFYLLMGADQYAELHNWHEVNEVLRLARVVVLDRGSGSRAAAVKAGLAGVVRRVSVTGIDVSATEIRHRVAAGRPIRYLVPAAVEHLIRAHDLYGGRQ